MSSVMAARWVGRNSGPMFSPFVDQIHQIHRVQEITYFCMFGCDRSLQRRFPRDNIIVLRSGYIRNKAAELFEIEPKFLTEF